MSFFSKKSRSPSKEEEKVFKTNPMTIENEKEYIVPPLSPKSPTSPNIPRGGSAGAPTTRTSRKKVPYFV